MKPDHWLAFQDNVTFRHPLMFPTIRGWDELGLGKCCVFYQDIETRNLLLDATRSSSPS
jgi:hypothetical protein